MRIPALLLIGLALAGAACGSDAASTATTPSTIVSGSTEVFADKLTVGATGFYSFNSLGTGVAVTFGSLTSVATGATLTTPMRIGVGIPSGIGCGLQTFRDATPALTAQIAVPLDPGTFCISIQDIGGALAGDANFAVRVTQGTLTVKAGASVETFASNLTVNGGSARTFVVSGGGNVTVSLDSVTPSQVIGFGIGIWRVEKSLCSLYQAVSSGPGAKITATVDQGIYCVRVFDVGNLTDVVAFSTTIAHP